LAKKEKSEMAPLILKYRQSSDPLVRKAIEKFEQ
jgi:hypothetical protein